MSITSLRPIHRHAARPLNGPKAGLDPARLWPEGEERERFEIALMRAGHVDGATLLAAMAQSHFPVIEYLIQHGHIDENLAYKEMAAHWATGLADFARHRVDAHLLAQIDPAQALAQHWLP